MSKNYSIVNSLYKDILMRKDKKNLRACFFADKNKSQIAMVYGFGGLFLISILA